jgi:hypothetical protein
MSLPKSIDPAACPLCGGANECQLCSSAAYKGPCWCMKVKIPDELLNRISAEARNRACVCRGCVMKFHRDRMDPVAAPKILPGDFYFDGGLMVFTAAYHLRRGYCCDNGCRHCPFKTVAANAQ